MDSEILKSIPSKKIFYPPMYKNFLKLSRVSMDSEN